MVRLAHFSDIHVTAAALGWRLGDYFTKRYTSWINQRWLGRQQRFAHADEIVAKLVADLPGRAIDHIVFSGDATALGMEAELRRAADLLQVETTPIPGIAVPGNHDYLTRPSAESGLFERYFARWQTGVRVGTERYPFAQRVGPLWLVGVNAATGNWMPIDATGTVGAPQRERLRQLLARLEPGPRVLVIHFPIRLSSGTDEKRWHGLRDLPEVLAVCKGGGVRLWLHGHRHRPYFFDQPAWAPFPAICAGSGTERGNWSYNEYTVDGAALKAVRRAFDPAARHFEDVQTFELRLGPPLAG